MTKSIGNDDRQYETLYLIIEIMHGSGVMSHGAKIVNAMGVILGQPSPARMKMPLSMAILRC